MKMKELKKLNLGCGKDVKEGYVNLDKINLRGVDVIHDLTKFPYPFKDNTFDEIFAQSILEHLPNTVRVMEELHRISKPRAKIIVIVPYYHSRVAFDDPTHISFFTYRSFNHFTDKWVNTHYTKARFKILKRHVYGLRLIPTTKLKVWLSYLIPNLITALRFELEVIK